MWTHVKFFHFKMSTAGCRPKKTSVGCLQQHSFPVAIYPSEQCYSKCGSQTGARAQTDRSLSVTRQGPTQAYKPRASLRTVFSSADIFSIRRFSVERRQGTSSSFNVGGIWGSTTLGRNFQKPSSWRGFEQTAVLTP